MTRPNRAYFGISNTPGTSGNFTVAAAFDATFITLGAAHDGVTFPSVTIIESGLGAEVRTNCTYTHGTTTLTRGTLESSTTGSAINFTSAAKVQVTVGGADVARYDRALLGSEGIVRVGAYEIGSADEHGNGTTAILAGNLYLQPFLMAAPATVSGIQCSVTTGAAGNLRVGLYRPAADGTVVLLAEIATEIDTTSAATKSASFSSNLTLRPGYYVIGFVGSGTPTFRSGAAGGCFGALSGNLNNGGLGAYRNALTYPGAMPSTVDPTGWSKSLYLANRVRFVLTGV